MRHCVKAGLMSMYWTDANFKAHLQGNNEFIRDTTNTVFVFSIFRLSAAFTLLNLGCIIRCTVFILEIKGNGFSKNKLNYKKSVCRPRNLQREQRIWSIQNGQRSQNLTSNIESAKHVIFSSRTLGLVSPSAYSCTSVEINMTEKHAVWGSLIHSTKLFILGKHTTRYKGKDCNLTS
jgi:hypothetical protein